MDKTLIISIAIDTETGKITVATSKFDSDLQLQLAANALLDVIRSINDARSSIRKEPVDNG